MVRLYESKRGYLMKFIKEVTTFSSWIVSTVLISVMTDMFVGVVLGLATTVLTGFFMSYWADQFKGNKKGLTCANK